jgi:hypothetical protein
MSDMKTLRDVGTGILDDDPLPLARVVVAVFRQAGRVGELVDLRQDGLDQRRRVQLEMEKGLVVCDRFDVGVWLELVLSEI